MNKIILISLCLSAALGWRAQAQQNHNAQQEHTCRDLSATYDPQADAAQGIAPADLNPAPGYQVTIPIEKTGAELGISQLPEARVSFGQATVSNQGVTVEHPWQTQSADDVTLPQRVIVCE